ncbi:hypothetical protein Celal_3080 [Cellulophaga algicola DSM 14237]|uniref:Uncharacterized protein n=1 Tax=Cellulophaga algicola (strain DSM 14237 / IC166 / ACAM 630) TaxID=688270 RepID=E6X412_CELAD|nr:hypothetical protein [Cellulophaga algicola]ADV50354.1 hypothetical protein Celal_3080 [Cellulophaga algicola DSM 14237]
MIGIGIIFSVLLFICVYFFRKHKTNTIRSGGQLKSIRLEELSIIQLDNLVVDGFNRKEEQYVDEYGAVYTPEKYQEHLQSENIFTMGKEFRQESVENFFSVVNFPLLYNEKEYVFKLKIPLDEITLRMRFYNKKSTKIYLSEKQYPDGSIPQMSVDGVIQNSFKENKDKEGYFIIDLSFLGLPTIGLECLGAIAMD